MSTLPKGMAITYLQKVMKDKTPVTIEIKKSYRLRACQIIDVTHDVITVSSNCLTEKIDYEDITDIMRSI